MKMPKALISFRTIVVCCTLYSLLLFASLAQAVELNEFHIDVEVNPTEVLIPTIRQNNFYHHRPGESFSSRDLTSMDDIDSSWGKCPAGFLEINSTAQTCKEVVDALKLNKPENLQSLISPHIVLTYDNLEMPFGGIYVGEHHVHGYFHRLNLTMNIKSRKAKIISLDEPRESCIIKVNSTGTFNRNNSTFTNLVHIMDLSFAVGKLHRVKITDGKTYDDQMKAYRTNVETLAMKFNEVLHTHGPKSQELSDMIAEDATFEFVTKPSNLFESIDDQGMKGFNALIHLFRNLRYNFDMQSCALMPYPNSYEESSKCKVQTTTKDAIIAICMQQNMKFHGGKVRNWVKVKFNEDGKLASWKGGPTHPLLPWKYKSKFFEDLMEMDNTEGEMNF